MAISADSKIMFEETRRQIEDRIRELKRKLKERTIEENRDSLLYCADIEGVVSCSGPEKVRAALSSKDILPSRWVRIVLEYFRGKKTVLGLKRNDQDEFIEICRQRKEFVFLLLSKCDPQLRETLRKILDKARGESDEDGRWISSTFALL
ncbi:MAG: uncharacterized protein A8A55_2092 [Amphiamblys sp. WSBS2006]|nr:MAG: uncharacterized protein A8A55_2092 [Amphiamblys sp. WSBS2006]